MAEQWPAALAAEPAVVPVQQLFVQAVVQPVVVGLFVALVVGLVPAAVVVAVVEVAESAAYGGTAIVES